MCDDKNIISVFNKGHKDRAWIEIELNNLKNNVDEIQKLLGDRCKIMAVVKANAYGHGAIEISKYLNSIGIVNFAVATIDEALELRSNGVGGNILILGYTNPDRFDDLIRYNLIQNVINFEYAGVVNKFGKKIRVHIKIDTGMCRLGEKVTHVDKINKIFDMCNLDVEAIFTHLHVDDSQKIENVNYTSHQIRNFYNLVDCLKNEHKREFKVHIMNSYGAIDYPELSGDYARVGICLYGVKSSKNDEFKNEVNLKPVLSLKARIACVKEINANDGVSYGRDFIAKHKMKIATVTIGYADGYPRCLSNTGTCVLINGRKTPILGRICMDQLIVDVTDIDNVNTGSIVTLIGKDGNEFISVEDISEKAGTISNEILSRLSLRLEYCYNE